jgi:rhomboid family protein
MFPFGDTIPTKRREIVTYILVAINVLSYLWLQSLPQDQQERVTTRWGFIPARIEQLSDPNKIVVVQRAPRAIFWGNFVIPQPRPPIGLRANPPQILESAVTCMFLHGGWLHLIGNMWFLLIFGNNIEDRLGHGLYAAFYFFGGLAATAVHWAIDPTATVPIIGASGAIAAILGAYAVTYPHARIKTLVFLFLLVTVIELPAYVFLVMWFIMQLTSGLGALGGQMDGGVAWWAHVGGFVVGAITMLVLNRIVPEDGAPKLATSGQGPIEGELEPPGGFDPWRRNDDGFRW